MVTSTQNGRNAMSVTDRAKSILKTASEIISGERNDQYGSPEESFSTIARLWNVYLNNCRNGRDFITKTDVAMMMILLKVARTNGEPTKDSLVDIAGYAALTWPTLTED
jgi:hypothetical protein